MRVEIDGELYVPANGAVANSEAILRGLVALWWGDTSKMGERELREKCGYLKVCVSDSFDSGTGDTLDVVMASIAENTK